MTLTDEQLCEQVRSGSTDAFSELWRRHHGEALGYARKLNPRFAEDAVSDVMTTVFESLRSGKGPNRSFRSYVLLSVRNTVYRGSAKRVDDELPDDERLHAEIQPAPVEAEEEARAVHSALQQLPERWREVLVLTEIHRKSLAEVGALLGLESNAVSALLRRARAGLRRSWVAAHFSGAQLSSDCSNVVEAFGDFRWGRPSQRQREWFERHVSDCRDCIERRGVHAWLSQAVGLAVLPIAWIGGASLGASVKQPARTVSNAIPGSAGVAGFASAVGATVVAALVTVFLTLAPYPDGAAEKPAVKQEDQAGQEDHSDQRAAGSESRHERDNELSAGGAVSSSGARATVQQDTSIAEGEAVSAQVHTESAVPVQQSGETEPPQADPLAPQPSLPEVAPVQPEVWTESIIGSSRPGAILEFLLSDATTMTAVADADGNFTVNVSWSELKPAFGYTLQRVQ